VRVDAIGHIPAVLREIGLDPDAVLAATGLDPRAFDDPLSEIPMASLGRLLAAAVAASGCEHVGLLVGERSGTASLGVVGLLVRHSPDVGAALRNLTAHLHLRDRGAVASLEVESGVARFGYEISEAGVEAVDQICDGAMAIAMNILRELCSPAWRPSEVLFAHTAPADLRPFRRVFGARLRFDAERTALVFPAKWLAHATQGADRQHFRAVSAWVDALETSNADDFVARLRRELRMILLGRKGSVGEVARRLSLHRRTLNRRLQARGTSVHRLVEEVRFEIARQLVVNTRMPLTEVAAVLGYADASAFTRAFRRWTGHVPSAWRRAHAAPGARGRPVPAVGRGVHG
jgi:AraC-like DNA-binding protein